MKRQPISGKTVRTAVLLSLRFTKFSIHLSMLKRTAKQFSFLITDIPFAERHVAIRILLHSFFFFVLVMYTAMVNDTKDELIQKCLLILLLAVYFNVYYFILQCRLPIMILLLGIEYASYNILFLYPMKSQKWDDAVITGIYLMYLWPLLPVLHVAYMELLYRLRSELAAEKP